MLATSCNALWITAQGIRLYFLTPFIFIHKIAQQFVTRGAESNDLAEKNP